MTRTKKTPKTGHRVVVKIHRERGRSCSSCSVAINAGIHVQQARVKELHFLFCRRCAARIGKVGASDAWTVSKERGR